MCAPAEAGRGGEVYSIGTSSSNQCYCEIDAVSDLIRVILI
jgi:hypothetical protein